MTTLAALPDCAEMALPPWIWGGKPDELLVAAGLRGRRPPAAGGT